MIHQENEDNRTHEETSNDSRKSKTDKQQEHQEQQRTTSGKSKEPEGQQQQTGNKSEHETVRSRFGSRLSSTAAVALEAPMPYRAPSCRRELCEQQARAARESPEEKEARRRRKRERGVQAVKRHWHYQALQEAGAERPRTPPRSPRALSKRAFERAMQEWRRELSERVQQGVQRGEISEVYIEHVHERVVIRSYSCPGRPC